MRYSGLIKNDVAAAPGVSVTFFTQGCPHHCEHCFNPETWDYNGGKEFTNETLEEIIAALEKNNIQRNLCLMGGEPLCPENVFQTLLIINTVKQKIPNTKIYIWTGYLLEDLLEENRIYIKEILQKADVLIDGPYIHEERDITLQMRGSKNQRILKLDFLK
jgi:anaerobic ribonucleoside-triphosphate reductase activating protein